ncbi:hypothetical protein [Nonlabens ulvanivorans]|uniref:Uncharacterized protein n=1 Tax=Nonlabens ulvanivorans TaxID=906888 RepID=A0A084K052_NONUL|nr:hypothetical protein [Nonlabens ulvanivorans]KEZ94586.1 hypothetical protein IL45_00495 [Nonlabens ulvanivorans]PRX12498.1 hypothetical protein LY02_02563 [Nonlabens ulvanivorans]
MKSIFILLTICFITISCTPDDNFETLSGEANVTLNIDEEFKTLLNGAAYHEIYEITRQANIYNTSEITLDNSTGTDLYFYTFKPAMSYEGSQSVIIVTKELSENSSNVRRVLTTTYNFTIR